MLLTYRHSPDNLVAYVDTDEATVLLCDRYGGELTVETVYEQMLTSGLPATGKGSGEVTVHDPCPLRFQSPVQECVRTILSHKGVRVQEMRHSRKRTICCGAGGSVGFVRPDLARAWSELRSKEAEGKRIVTYCAGCTDFLSKVSAVTHIADLIFAPKASLEGKIKISRAPFTYINRIELKRRFQKVFGKVQGIQLRSSKEEFFWGKRAKCIRE